jgi:predicted N-acetyltransferase YhbS
VIRTATPADADALRALHRRSSYIWEEDHAQLDAHPDLFGVDPAALAAGHTRVAVDDEGAIIGFATVTDACELEDLFVEPELMRRGIGGELVADAVARAEAAGHTRMTVVAATRTLAFYERAGFAVESEATTQFGPALLLARALSPATSRGPSRPPG